MAVVHGGESSFMRVNIKSAQIAALMFFIVYVYGSIHLFIKTSQHIDYAPFATFISALVSILILGLIFKKIGDYLGNEVWSNTIGLRSENTAFLELKQLPPEYHIFRNVQFDHMYDIDFVVVGPRGVFVLETNSIRGIITSKNDLLYVDDVILKGKDRLKQALRNTLEISSYLDDNYFVQGAVVFAHYKTKMDIGFRKVRRVNVIKHQWIKKFILEESDNQHLSPEQQQHIVDKLLLTYT